MIYRCWELTTALISNLAICTDRSEWFGSRILTKATVPPPGTVGTAFLNNAFLATSIPGVCGPPMNLWGEMKTASMALQ